MHKDAHNQRARAGFLVVRDVSDVVTLQQSEQRNKTILATLPDAIGRFSRRGYYLEIINTGTFTQVLTREQLEGKHMLDYLPYATAKKMQRHIDALYATGEVQSFYYHLYNDSGKRVYRHVRLVLLNAREHIAIMRDVTEHMQTERALEQSEARFREIAATIDAVFFVFDLVSQHFRYISPTFDTIVGASRQLLYDFSDIQTTFSHLIYPADWQAFHEAFTRMSEGHEVLLEYRLRHASSGLRWLRTHVSRGYTVSATVSAETTPTHGYQDDLDSATADQHMIGVTTDITEHKHAEAALSASEARLHAILQALPDGIGRFSREGRYLEVLHQGYYTPITPTQDIIGKSIAEVLPHEAAERALQHIGRIFAGSPLEVFEYDVILTDTTHHREIYLVPFDTESCIGVVHDITERKRAELALSQALTEKTALLNEIHHRVKNNLQVIVSLLMLQARATPNPAVKDALNANRQRITAMATVHKLMYASGSLSEVNFHDYLRAIVPNLLPPQGAPAVNINITTAISLPIEDAIPLGIITAELLENIFKHAFTDPHPPSHPMNADTNKDDVFSDDISSEATLSAEAFNEFDEPAEIPADDSAPTVTLALEQHQHTITLRISDNGVGLPEGFDTERLQRHTSLGISIIDALVSQIGGTWRMARSTPGTLVEVTFAVLEPPHIMPE
jgi:PAS domain S-box-containing protein